LIRGQRGESLKAPPGRSGRRGTGLLLTARWVFPDPERRLSGGGVFVRRGRVLRILPDRPALERFARRESVAVTDLGERVLAPGFVDAHAHLELTCLEGELPDRGSFSDWIRALVAARRLRTRAQLVGSALDGARRLLAGGTTCVGDIDSSGASESALRRSPLRARVYREVLDGGDAGRAAGAMDRVRRRFASSARIRPGLSPHAPYSVGDSLLRSARAVAERRGWPACVHWAETAEEVEWLAHGSGPMGALLPGSARRGAGEDGLAILARTGWLTPRLALVHGNHPSRGDVERVARSGAVLVHCPGTHAFFDREPFPIRTWLDAGVTVALGTDGLSSNRALDMRREMALLRRHHPWLSAERVFGMATRSGARALCLAGTSGEIAPGGWADLVVHGFPDLSRRESRSPRLLLDALTRGQSTVDAAWIGGRRPSPADFPRRVSESSARIAE